MIDTDWKEDWKSLLLMLLGLAVLYGVYGLLLVLIIWGARS